MKDLHFLSACEIASNIASKKVSAGEVLEHFLARIDRYNTDLNAVVIEVRERARKRALAADAALSKGECWGPLHGVPMTVKESFNLAGTPTTWGNPGWVDNIAKEDAEAVKKLALSGVNVHGKTNLPLMLSDNQSYNDVYGTTNNPYDHTRTPGGSSGGSAAALAAGLTALEAGSDIAGSIRNPAHFCGVFGHKPTYNLLSAQGHTGPANMKSTSDITVIGPMARSARDLEVAVRAMAIPDAIMARGYQLKLPELGDRKMADMKVAVWMDDERAPVNKEVRERVELVGQALRDRGAKVDFDARPGFTSKHADDVYLQLMQATMAQLMPPKDYESLKEYVAKFDDSDQSKRAMTMRAQVATFKDWGRLNEMRTRLRWQWHEFFSEWDVLITPIMATAAYKHDHRPFRERTILVDDQERPYFEQVFWAGLSGASYLPSTVIPTGLNDEGLPIGVQIIGPEYADLITIEIAQRLEQDGFTFTPPLKYI